MPFHVGFVPLFFLANQIPLDGKASLVLDKRMYGTGSLLSVWDNSGLGFGWCFSNGSEFRGGKYCLPLFEKDHISHTACIGPSIELVSQWYIGNDFGVILRWGLPDSQCAIGIEWYPIEGFDLSINFDLFTRQVGLKWELREPEDLLESFTPVFAAYWLASWIECQHEAQ
jgi:hypothetical protein